MSAPSLSSTLLQDLSGAGDVWEHVPVPETPRQTQSQTQMAGPQ